MFVQLGTEETGTLWGSTKDKPRDYQSDFCGATVWLRQMSSLVIQQFHACLGKDSRKAGAYFKFQRRQNVYGGYAVIRSEVFIATYI